MLHLHCEDSLVLRRRTALSRLLKKAKRYGYLPSDFEHVHNLVECMESKLFNSVCPIPIMYCITCYHLQGTLVTTFDNNLTHLLSPQKTAT